MSYQTYTLTKDDELILETQAATVDRAIDYFAIDYPQIFSVKSGYSVGLKQRDKYQLFQKEKRDN
jgi:hypothetical protein